MADSKTDLKDKLDEAEQKIAALEAELAGDKPDPAPVFGGDAVPLEQR